MKKHERLLMNMATLTESLIATSFFGSSTASMQSISMIPSMDIKRLQTLL
jgi:hypothetical protein